MTKASAVKICYDERITILYKNRRKEAAFIWQVLFVSPLILMHSDFDDGVAVVTFHPQVIGRGHRLLALERWIDELVKMGVVFARCDDVARQVLAGRAYGTYRPATE